MKDAEIEAEIEDFIEGFKQPTVPAARGSMGSGRYLVIPARVVRGQPIRTVVQ